MHQEEHMLKVEFLNDQNTRAFTDWFAGLLSEQRSLDFMHVDGVYASLHDAFADYAWPNKRTVRLPALSGYQRSGHAASFSRSSQAA